MEYDVAKVIELINKNGRQGPRDLLSAEVYLWVKAGLNIDYSAYVELLEQNMIHADEREKSRDFYFIRDNSNRILLFKSTEEEIRKYICYIVRENPNITSHQVIAKFKVIYPDYTLVDLMNQENLQAPQPIIDQTIRNVLVSNYTKEKNNALFYRSEDKPYKYTIKPEGVLLADEISLKLLNAKKENDKHYFLENVAANSNLVYTEDELRQIALKDQAFDIVDMINKHKKKSEKYIFPTDPKIKATRLFQVGYKCEYNPEHITFPTSAMSNFLEGHHLVPMAAQRNFQYIKLDRIQNIVALCPICHSQIHYGTREAKWAVFSNIIKQRKKDLEEIGFTEPILKEIFEVYY